MKFKMILFLIFIGVMNFAQSKITVKGKVTDEKSIPLPGANIFLKNTLIGCMSNDDGSFSLRIPNKKQNILIIQMMGYKKYEKEIPINNKKTITLEVILESTIIQLKETVISASSFSSEEGKGIVLRDIDIYTTPGGAADIFQSLKTFPGVTQVNESAELYVRGGSPEETLTVIDQTSVYHPYTYESSYGGLFSNLNTSAIKNIYFSCGGFSAKYGNTLSGILSIETKDEVHLTQVETGLSFAGGFFNLAAPLLKDKLSMRLYSKKSFTKMLMTINNNEEKFLTIPTSYDIQGNITYKYSHSGKVKLNYFITEDLQKVKVERAEFDGSFYGNQKNNILSLNHSDLLFTNGILKTGISFAEHENKWQLGVLNILQKDLAYKIISDYELIFSEKIKFLSGFLFEKRKENYKGFLPENDYNVKPDAKKKIFDEDVISKRFGFYSEVEITNLFNINNFSLIAGARFDYFPIHNASWFDPRFSIGYKISSTSSLKFSFGIFHQLPSSKFYRKEDGNPNLSPMKSLHYVISYNKNYSPNNSFRIELYHKDYEDLPLEDDKIFYSNNGYGFANGIDIILKGKTSYGFSGWLSYGFINTKRFWKDFEKLSRSSFDIKHQLSFVLKYSIGSMWEIGINYKIASGRPFTPINNSIFRKLENVYEPIYGEKNSSRYPTYQRLDFRLTHLNMIFENVFAVIYLEVLNILNIENIFGYSYNKNYSMQRKIKSYFGRRTVVMGIQLSF